MTTESKNAKRADDNMARDVSGATVMGSKPIAAPAAENFPPPPKPSAKMRYFHVRFTQPATPNENPQWDLTVNGETLMGQRGRETILPESYVEAARHATHMRFSQTPNEPRKRTGTVMIYPFEVKGEATEAEFLALKTAGTNKVRSETATPDEDDDVS